MALSAEAMEMLIEFRTNANPGDLHPNDRERWRKFVIQAHDDGDEIAEDDVVEVLRPGWQREAEVVGRLAADYCYARELLRDYDEWLGR